MDQSITLSYGSRSSSTVVSNIFVDRYMTDARGSDVKVYIYLLRCLQDPSTPVSIESIADALDETEKDIRTALRYWDKQHVLSVRCTRDGKIKSIRLYDLDEEAEDEVEAAAEEEESNITLLPSVKAAKKAPKPVIKEEPAYEEKPIVKPNYTMTMIHSFRENYPEFDRLVDYVESAAGKTLTTKNLQTISFIFEELSFPTELIRFLYDYSIGKGKFGDAYIEKVARDWHEKGIKTVKAAEMEVAEFSDASKASGRTRAKSKAQDYPQRVYSDADYLAFEKKKLGIK